MAQRVRYLSAKPMSENDLRRLSESLLKAEYSDKTGVGFIDIRFPGDFLEGTFVERFQYEEEVIDPFGNNSKFTRTQFSIARFRLSSHFPELELYNPPRSTSQLLTELSKGLNFRFSFSSVEIDLSALLRILKRNFSSFAIVAATLKDIGLDANVSAHIALSGSVDISKHLKTVSFGEKRPLRKLTIMGTHECGPFKAELTADGRVEILNGDHVSLIRVFKNALAGQFS